MNWNEALNAEGYAQLLDATRWRFQGKRVLWIADTGIGAKPIALKFKGEHVGEAPNSVFLRSVAKDDDALQYTPPNPWSAVTNVPSALLSVANGGWQVTLCRLPSEPLPNSLPPRIFSLVEYEDKPAPALAYVPWRPLTEEDKRIDDNVLLMRLNYGPSSLFIGRWRVGYPGEVDAHLYGWRDRSSGAINKPTHWAPMPSLMVRP